MSKIPGMVLSALLAVVVGCSDQEASSHALNDKAARKVQSSQQLNVPLKGVWNVGALDFATYYVISLDEATGAGNIVVEASGEVLRQYKFEVSGPNTIRIQGAQRGPHEGSKFSLKEIAEIMELKDPPQYLQFSRDAPSVPNSKKGETTLYCNGLFASFPIPMERLLDGQRAPLPFRSVQANLDVEIPPGTQGKFSGNTVVIGDLSAIVFDPPVHPLGHVRNLRINGKDVAIKDTKLANGMLSTRGFGEIEFVMVGPQNTRIMATHEQVASIRKWLEISGK